MFFNASSTQVQEAERAVLRDGDEIRVMVLMWTLKRGNEGEQDTHLGVVYWAGPQGAPQINPLLTLGANHNFKASLCPIPPWPWGQTQRQPRGRVSPLDSLEMDAVFLSDMQDVRVLISSAKGEKLALGSHLDVQNSHWCPWMLRLGGATLSSSQSSVLCDCAIWWWLFSLFSV